MNCLMNTLHSFSHWVAQDACDSARRLALPNAPVFIKVGRTVPVSRTPTLSPCNSPSITITALVVWLAVCCIQSGAADDPVMGAMQAEIDRTMSQLQLPDSPKPYFVSCSFSCTKSVNASAAFGALTGSWESKYAGVSVAVRVGEYKLDNSNFSPQWGGSGWSRLDWAIRAPMDEDPVVIRRAIWWAIDNAYKEAVEKLKRKKAVLENRSTPPVADDFARAPVLDYSSSETAQVLPKIEIIENQVRALSQFHVERKMLRSSDVSIGANVSEQWYVTSEGTKIHEVDNSASITASAMAQADDGIMVGDGIRMVARCYDQLPPLDQQKMAVVELGKRVEAMREAPLLDDFVGPVLFEGEASVELCSMLLPEMFASVRQPLVEGSQMGGGYSDDGGRSLRRKIGRRVMATGFNVTDDPTLEVFNGTPVTGTRAVDAEGVKAEKVELVKKGILKTLLTTRTPDKKLPVSNGHAVSAGHGTSSFAGPTTLIVTYEDGMDETALRDRLVQAVNDQDVEYGLLVRRMPDTSLPVGGRSGGEGDDSVIEKPLYAFCVYPDGSEKLVRVVALKGIGFRAFKDALAAGKTLYVSNEGPHRTIIAPSVLFEEGIVVKPERNVFKPPLLQSPMQPDK